MRRISGSSRRHFRVRQRLLIVGLGVGTLGLLAAPIGAAASVSHKKPLTLLQKGLNYYAGQTITIISPDAVGGGFNTVSRIVAPFLASYLHATVNVTNISQANTIAGQDQFEADPKNGLTVGMINAGTDIEAIVTNTSGVNFNPQKVVFLGGNNVSAGGGFECLTSAGYTSFKQVVQSTSPVSEVIVSSGTQTLQLDLTNAAFNIDAKVIGGFTNTSAEVQGEESGLGNCGVLSIATPAWGPYLEAGQAHLLMETKAPNPAIAYYNTTLSAMSLATAFKDFPAKTRSQTLARNALTQVTAVGVGHQFNLAAGTPLDEVTAMRAAVQAALTNISCENQLLAQGQSNGFVSGSRALGYYKSEYAALKKVSALIESALGI